ncbi:hypothetical protein GGS26DRAFT_165408 [Hypomontagnella submonticulosa]|nr:hypothetical protein GGS26DRAFT_165408 [Hypomontagnella submonticulosa]
MAKYSRRGPKSEPSDRGESPPPAYSRQPPPSQPRPRPREQTPLLQYVEVRLPRNQPGPLITAKDFEGFIFFLIGAGIFFLVIFVLLRYLPNLGMLFPPHAIPPPPIFSIAIVGAGPAGISAARHLHRKALVRDIHLNITLFESAPLVGGQLALNASTGGPVFPHDDPTQDPISAEDIAGTALLWANPLFTKTSEEVLGDKVEFSELSSQQVSYFSGQHVVSEATRPYSKTPMMNWLGLIWRYGSSVWSAAGMVKDGGDIRDRFVDTPVVSDIMQLMISLGIMEFAQQPAQDALNSRGIGGAYVTDILEPQVERAHSQKIADINAYAMILAAFQEDSANAYIGGELIDRLEQIVSTTGATVRTSTEVLGLKHERTAEDKSAWLVRYNTPVSSWLQAEAFDKVVIAAPNFFDLYHGASAEEVEAASALTYSPAHVTFFTVPTRINPDVYGNVDQVLFVEEQDEGSSLKGVRELAFVREVVRIGDNGEKIVEYLYRALSDGDATEQLRQLDLGITWMYQARLEKAYPYLYPLSRFPPFKLSDQGLWWTSAIHTVANTIDMSWLAGKIVAEEVIKDIAK